MFSNCLFAAVIILLITSLSCYRILVYASWNPTDKQDGKGWCWNLFITILQSFSLFLLLLPTNFLSTCIALEILFDLIFFFHVTCSILGSINCSISSLYDDSATHSIFYPLICFLSILFHASTHHHSSRDFIPWLCPAVTTCLFYTHPSDNTKHFPWAFLWYFKDRSLLVAKWLNLSFLKPSFMMSYFVLFIDHQMVFSKQM